MPSVHLRGIDMFYESEGVGLPVMLLHGFPFNRTMWRDQFDFLKDRYRVITPDLRGMGETTQGDLPSTMDEMARDLVALLDKLKLQRVILGGLSMGGYVALNFYRKFDLRVRGLMLFDTRAEADTPEAKENRERLAQRAETEGMDPVVEAFLPKLLAPATFEEQPEVVERLRSMMLTTRPEGAAAALRGMAARTDSTSVLDRIMAPTLIVVGSEDAITTVADAKMMRREIMGSHLEIIEGAGHVSNFERPGEFNRAVENYLATL
jgi:pimeloyl-ACP methyl ester carboxylesterase